MAIRNRRPQRPARERRRDARYPVEGIFGTLRPYGPVSLVNLSRRGVAFAVDDRLNVGETYLLRLQHQGHGATMQVKVSWLAPRRRLAGRVPHVSSRFIAGASVTDIYRDTAGGIWDAVQPDLQAAL